jgi:ParB family chromosome partitioning protein
MSEFPTKMAIANIKIGTRHRKDMGDLDGLAANIAELGCLIHAIPVRPDGELIAGERRLEAAKLLGWTEIDVRVVDLKGMIIHAEVAENVLRKPFTPSEAVAIAAELEPMEREAAKERERGGGKDKGSAKFSDPPGRALDKIARAVGMSRPTLTKARAVVEAAESDPELFGPVLEEMDATGKVEAAYRKIQPKSPAGSEPPPDLEDTAASLEEACERRYKAAVAAAVKQAEERERAREAAAAALEAETDRVAKQIDLRIGDKIEEPPGDENDEGDDEDGNDEGDDEDEETGENEDEGPHFDEPVEAIVVALVAAMRGKTGLEVKQIAGGVHDRLIAVAPDDGTSEAYWREQEAANRSRGAKRAAETRRRRRERELVALAEQKRAEAEQAGDLAAEAEAESPNNMTPSEAAGSTVVNDPPLAVHKPVAAEPDNPAAEPAVGNAARPQWART